MKTYFWEFDQNNSGGSFLFDEKKGISACVIIEAMDSAHANLRAGQLGIYFDGCEKELDCSCCGDRWYEARGEGDEEPFYYGEPLKFDPKPDPYPPPKKRSIYPEPRGFVHYLDGTFKPFYKD
jgi:hypothetical protein